ncbi:hypothetical protein [Halobacteriaceae bacterium SHR40]|uniref:hypothetical protein n=1 Tax=Halovenus amylolytica TaxID=2500550 RepID=UPI000FE38842
MYDRFRVEEPNRTPDICCVLSDEKPQSDEVLGHPRDNYGRDGNNFVVQSGSNYLVTDPDWQEFAMNRSPGWEPFKTVYMIEFELRRRLLENRQALIHASGVQFEGQTILFPAWRSAGKTNTLLSLLFAGGDYLSDDRLWVDEDGSVQGYPTPVNVGTEQLESFTELETPEEKLDEKVENFVDAKIDPSRSFFDKVASYLASQYIDSERTFQDLHSMVPGAKYVDKASVDAVVLLRAAPKQARVNVEQIPTSQVVRALRTIHHYEWNEQLEEYAMATDSLFPAADRTEVFESIRTEEAQVQRQFLQSTPTLIARIPRTRIWEADGIRTQITDAFSDLPTEVEPGQETHMTT